MRRGLRGETCELHRPRGCVARHRALESSPLQRHLSDSSALPWGISNAIARVRYRPIIAEFAGCMQISRPCTRLRIRG
jgi:hypothetical protein